MISMDAKAEGFGDLDQAHEDDFASFLRPRTSGGPAVAPSARKAGSKDKHTTQKPQEAPTAAAGALIGQESAEGVEEPQHAPAGRTRRGRPPGTGAASSAKLVLWTPISIRTRMQRVRTETGRKYADQILDALEATVDDLPNLVAAAVGAKQVQGRLFSRRVEAEATDEVRKQLTIPGVSVGHLAVIDDLVDTTGAGSRSKLVNVALDQALPPG